MTKQPRKVAPRSDIGRALAVSPRRRGYKHRPIITVVDHLGMTEHGEPIHDLAMFATSSEPHIWVTMDPAHIILTMRARFGHTDYYTDNWMDSLDPDIPEGVGHMSKARVGLFGFHRATASAGIRRQARHMVWEPARMFSDPTTAADNLSNTHPSLLQFATDVRSWCEEHDLPLRATLPGLSAALLRDPRFWPNPRGSVPRWINDQVRPHLPGVHQRRLAPLHIKQPTVTSLDQRRAYHKAAQEVPTPDPTSLFARGFYNDPENAPVWAHVGSPTYERIVKQPGLLAVRATSRPARKDEIRTPAVDNLQGQGIVYLWANELPDAERDGLKVHGLVAAWTSTTADEGLPRYGAWAEQEIDRASPYRQFWLKPTLHATYGLLGARARILVSASKTGEGQPTVYVLQGVPFEVRERRTQRARAPLTVNVAMLGVLQAEIRRRTLNMASVLQGHDVPILHIHADGLHAGPAQLPFLDDGHWSLAPITNLVYEDDVSWISDQRDILPGRDIRARVELRRQIVRSTLAGHGAHRSPGRHRPGRLDHHALSAAIIRPAREGEADTSPRGWDHDHPSVQRE